MAGFVTLIVIGVVVWAFYRAARKKEEEALRDAGGGAPAGSGGGRAAGGGAPQAARRVAGGATGAASGRESSGGGKERAMALSGTFRGHAYEIKHATESDWPVTSLRLQLRKSLPAGVAIHPAGAAPWSSGRIGTRTVTTGDSSFDAHFGVRCERPGDVHFLGPELRAALVSAICTHPGLWLGNDGLVCVERGHLRDRARLEAILEELVTLATMVSGAAAEGRAAGAPAEAGRARGQPQQAQAQAAARAAAAPAAGGAAGGVESFVQACFDRGVAAYEVNRRLHNEWIGRRLSGEGRLVDRALLGGHDFDFGDLKGFRVEVQVAGLEDIAPIVRVQIQVDASERPAIEQLVAGGRVRFEGQVLSANPLLLSLQLVSARVVPA